MLTLLLIVVALAAVLFVVWLLNRDNDVVEYYDSGYTENTNVRNVISYEPDQVYVPPVYTAPTYNPPVVDEPIYVQPSPVYTSDPTPVYSSDPGPSIPDMGGGFGGGDSGGGGASSDF